MSHTLVWWRRGANGGSTLAGMSAPRSSVRLPLAALLVPAAVTVPQGCGPLESLLDTTAPIPTGGPPPAGFATEMLDAQNAVRADPASVGGSPAPSPALPALAWSSTVAARAQAWADGCVYMHDTTALHDLGYGENIAATAPPGARDATYIVVEGWAAEAPFYDYATNGCDAANPANAAHTCGHYTQLVWRSTTVVGCGFRTCTTGSPFGASFPTWDYWVCDYAPPGNYVGQRPY